MKSFLSALQFCLVLACAAGFLLGFGATFAGFWWLGLPFSFGSIWAAMAILREPW